MRGRISWCALGLMAVPWPTKAALSSTIQRKTERALVDQLRCKRPPEVAKAINAMLRNNLIRYRAGADGEYLFDPRLRLRFLGFRIKHIVAFDQNTSFRRAPRVRAKLEGRPFHHLQIEVVAPLGLLKLRAKKAGMVESWTSRDHPGLEIDDDLSHLSPKSRLKITKVRCVAW